MKLKRLSNTQQQLLRFALVGGGATLVHAAVFQLLFAGFFWSQLTANVAGFVVALLFSFAGQSLFTFKAQASGWLAWLRLFMRFSQAALLGFALNLFWAALVIDWLQLSHYWYLALLVGVTPILLFAINRLWVFRQSTDCSAK